MKKIKILAVMALLIIFGCSKDDVTNIEDSNVFEEGNLSLVNGERRNNPNNGINDINFYSNSDVNLGLYNGCLQTGLKLLKYGNFSGKLSGFGKINSSLSTYEIDYCEKLESVPPNDGQPFFYYIEAKGKIALGSRDYCNITITGTIYLSDDTSYGFVYGAFVGEAITDSGVGKLKGLDNKNFSVYGGNVKGPSINLDEGTITLRITDFGQ